MIAGMRLARQTIWCIVDLGEPEALRRAQPPMQQSGAVIVGRFGKAAHIIGAVQAYRWRIAARLDLSQQALFPLQALNLPSAKRQAGGQHNGC